MIQEIFNQVLSLIKGTMVSFQSKLSKITTISTTIVQKVQAKLSQFVSQYMRSPRDKKDYFKVMGVYVSKKLAILSIMVLVAVGYFGVAYVYPWADGRIWTSRINLTSAKYSTFSGKAKVYDAVGVLVYEGKMDSGMPSGKGVQYDSNGNLLYEGNFEKGKYSGQGKLYNNKGVLIYEGAFSNNKFEGEGKQYNDNGKVIYVGNFSVGQRSGKGVEYNPGNSYKTYYGEFLNDKREGSGVVYDEDGTTILYEGKFSGGEYGGNGKLYKDGNLIYSGNFEKGKYSGTGDLYDEDTGALVYTGDFKEGKYDGKGKLYDKDTNIVVYEGQFSSGKKQGTGTSYDKLGSKQFEGTFRSDGVDYIKYLGKSVDDVTEGFGPETLREEKDNKLILTYKAQNVSVVFKIDSSKGEYVCEKFMLGTEKDFMGLGAKSKAVDRRAVMGDPYSSINYKCPDYYTTIFQHLEITINSKEKVPSDKYILDNYFIRFYFNEGRTELKCIEICTM